MKVRAFAKLAQFDARSQRGVTVRLVQRLTHQLRLLGETIIGGQGFDPPSDEVKAPLEPANDLRLLMHAIGFKGIPPVVGYGAPCVLVGLAYRDQRMK